MQIFLTLFRLKSGFPKIDRVGQNAPPTLFPTLQKFCTLLPFVIDFLKSYKMFRSGKGEIRHSSSVL